VNLSAQLCQQLVRLPLLGCVAFAQHLVEKFARPVLVAHLLVRLRQIELGGDFLPLGIRLRVAAGCAVCVAGYFGINPPGFVAQVVAFAFFCTAWPLTRAGRASARRSESRGAREASDAAAV